MSPAPPFVVILGYDEIAPATALAESLLGAGLDRSDIVIVFNPGPEESGDLTSPVEVERLPENVGYAGGMNAGLSLALASGRATAWVADTRLRRVRRRPADALVVPRHAPRGGRGGPHPLLARPTRHLQLGRLRRPTWALPPAGPRTAGIGPVGSSGLDGAALVVRPTIVTSVGGFDDRFFMYVEDVDLGLRLTSQKWDVVVLADAHATKESSIPERPATYSYLRAQDTTAMLAGLHRWVPLASFLGGLVVAAAPHLTRAPELRGWLRDVWVGRFGRPPPDLLHRRAREGDGRRGRSARLAPRPISQRSRSWPATTSGVWCSTTWVRARSPSAFTCSGSPSSAATVGTRSSARSEVEPGAVGQATGRRQRPRSPPRSQPPSCR